MNDTRPACSTASVSTPASFIATTSSHGMPSSRSITSTRRVTSVGCGRGHDRGALVGLGEHARDVEHVLGLEAEVELLDDRLREQLDERGRVGERGDRDPADEARREPRHRADVFAHEPRDLRALHLHDDLFAGAQPRRVHLRDRRRRDRRAVEALEHVVERAAEVELDDPAHDVERLGRHTVAEQLELGDELRREQALAARDDLAELDVGRARARRTRGAAGGRARAGRPRALAPVDQVPAARGRRRPGRRPGRPVRAGGSVPGLQPGGNWSRAWARRRSTSARHGMASGSTTHGPCSLNDPIARSGDAAGVRRSGPCHRDPSPRRYGDARRLRSSGRRSDRPRAGCPGRGRAPARRRSWSAGAAAAGSTPDEVGPARRGAAALFQVERRTGRRRGTCRPR